MCAFGLVWVSGGLRKPFNCVGPGKGRRRWLFVHVMDDEDSGAILVDWVASAFVLGVWRIKERGLIVLALGG